MNKKPIIAFLYDFDKTLCTTDMQDYTFIPSLGYTPGEFWSIANSFGFENRMDGLLAYMYTMIEECRKKGIRLDRDYLVSCGHAIELFPGVQDWFSRINAFGETLGVEIEHYVLSSGLREIIEGSGVSHEFKEIYACEFFYNEEGLASWPKLDVNFTNKTQFVYRINKGILDVAKDKELNASMPDDSKRIPFTNMIYIGDGLSDVPCMKMMRAYGGQAVAVFSLEMSREQLVTRILSNQATVENQRLVTGNLREQDWVNIANAASVLSGLDILIDDNPLLTVADMNAKCRRIDNLGLVVIDYLQLMASSGTKGYSGESRQQVVSDISRMLKIMAKELQVPVLCLSQLSRANEKREDKRPMLSDLRESGAIEQDADIVMFLYRDDYYNPDTEKKGIAEVIIAKQRNGPIGTIELVWLPDYTKFANLQK